MSPRRTTPARITDLRGLAPGSPRTPPVLPGAAAGKRALRPHARNPAPAGGAAAVRADALLLDDVAGALDEQVATVRAVGMLPAAHAAGEVARVDEPEARLRPDLA